MAITMSAQVPASSAWQTSFLDLPLELRDNVYNDLFQGASFTIYNPKIRPDLGVTFHFFYRFNGNRKHRNLPRWLFSCKQIFNEALEQWYRGATCSPCFCGGSSGRTAPGSYAAAFCDLDRAQSFDGPVLSTKNEMDCSYVLWSSLNAKSTHQPQIIVPRMSEHPVSYSVMDCFFKYLEQNTDHPAKQIKFSLTIAGSATGTKSVDLSHFESLGPRFHRVVFRIACPITSHGMPAGPVPGYPQLLDVAMLYPKIQHEAIRVGKYLVSGNGNSGWDLRDYLLPMRTSSDEVISNAFEWYVEVMRRPTQRNGQLKYEGMRNHRMPHRRGLRPGFDYFRPLQTCTHGRILVWICEDTGQVI
jgi:hypothetical protein